MEAVGRNDESMQPQESQAMLAAVEEGLGFLPNLFAALGVSPEALEAFLDLDALYQRSGLTAEQRQVVLLAASAENGCGYCVAGHTVFARDLDVSECVIEAARSGRPIENVQLEALRQLARRLVKTRGGLEPSDLDAFYRAGFDRRQALEVVIGVVLKTFSNTVAKMLDLPIDPQFQPGVSAPIERVAS